MALTSVHPVLLGADAPLSPVRRGPLHCRVVEQDALSVIVSGWAALAGRAVADNAFFHPDFVIPAMAALGDGVEVAVVSRPDGRPTAAVPVSRARLGRIAPAVRFWTHDYGPLGVPLVDHNALEASIAALVEGLAPAGSGRSLVAPDFHVEGPLAAAMGAVAEREDRPVAILGLRKRAAFRRVPGATVDLRAGLPARRRKEYARQLRRLGDLGPVAFESATEPDRVMARFEEFLAVELAGWKGRHGTALASDATTAALGRAVVYNHARSGTARIDSLRLGDHPVAVVVSFGSGRTAWTWKIAYDEAYARYSPGAQLMLAAPQSLLADPNVELIDSCAASDHPMIDHLWRDRLTLGTTVVGPPGGSALFRLGLNAERAEIAARARFRRLRDRLA